MKWLNYQYSEIDKQCYNITWDSLPTTPVTWQKKKAESKRTSKLITQIIHDKTRDNCKHKDRNLKVNKQTYKKELQVTFQQCSIATDY